MHVRVHVQTYTVACIHVYNIFLCLSVCARARARMSVCIGGCMCVYMSVCVRLFMAVYVTRVYLATPSHP